MGAAAIIMQFPKIDRNSEKRGNKACNNFDQHYYKSGTCTIQNRFPQGVTSTNTINHKYSFSKPKSKAEAIQVAAKKHSEAERRRRMRINGQYTTTLRDILPNLVKVSTKIHTNNLEGVCGGSSKDCVFPGGADKLSLENGDGDDDDDKGLVKVTFSCENRPGLISAVARTLRSMKGRVVKFEM
ncbi:transcription factor bhlh131 [Quercus suber]|uniref:Transcription factor bhlh131 n=1 Tax=Quercus suber TaxID=58331 RepID=A0AAW0KQF8_QUESU